LDSIEFSFSFFHNFFQSAKRQSANFTYVAVRYRIKSASPENFFLAHYQSSFFPNPDTIAFGSRAAPKSNPEPEPHQHDAAPYKHEF
jgi:hypothetical protein